MCVEEQHTELPVHVMSSATNKKSDVLAKKKKKNSRILSIISSSFSKGEVIGLFVGLLFYFSFPFIFYLICMQFEIGK